jgi:hypothetical protein
VNAAILPIDDCEIGEGAADVDADAKAVIHCQSSPFHFAEQCSRA